MLLGQRGSVRLLAEVVRTYTGIHRRVGLGRTIRGIPSNRSQLGSLAMHQSAPMVTAVVMHVTCDMCTVISLYAAVCCLRNLSYMEMDLMGVMGAHVECHVGQSQKGLCQFSLRTQIQTAAGSMPPRPSLRGEQYCQVPDDNAAMAALDAMIMRSQRDPDDNAAMDAMIMRSQRDGAQLGIAAAAVPEPELPIASRRRKSKCQDDLNIEAVRRVVSKKKWQQIVGARAKARRPKGPVRHKGHEYTFHQMNSQRMQLGKMARTVQRSLVQGATNITNILTSKKIICKSQLSVRMPKRGLSQLEVVVGDQPGVRRRFGAHQKVQLALEQTSNLNALGRSWNVHARTASRIKYQVAYSLLKVQTLMFGWVLQKLHQVPPEWALRSRLWDETGQRLVLKVRGGTTAATSRAGTSATWQVMVSRFRFAWGWSRTSNWRCPADCPSSVTWEPIIPAVPLQSTSAADIFAGLEKHTVTAEVHQFSEQLSKISRFWFQLEESDGATSNEKMIAAVGQQDHVGHLLCCNHANHIAEMAVVHVAALHPRVNLINDLYATALFLRMQGNMLRLKVAMRKVLSDKVTPRPGPHR